MDSPTRRTASPGRSETGRSASSPYEKMYSPNYFPEEYVDEYGNSPHRLPSTRAAIKILRDEISDIKSRKMVKYIEERETADPNYTSEWSVGLRKGPEPTVMHIRFKQNYPFEKPEFKLHKQEKDLRYKAYVQTVDMQE
jgi:hypothetical protein